MADAILMAGGTGGVSSDDVTAKREHVVKGYTALTADSDDEATEGLIEDRGDGAVEAFLIGKEDWASRIWATFRNGWYHRAPHPEGHEAYIYISYKKLAELLGLDSNKIVSSATYAGVSGGVIDRGDNGGSTSDEMWYYNDINGYVVRFEPGAYYKSGEYKPWVKVPRDLISQAINYHPEKTLSDTVTNQQRGQIKIVDTAGSNYKINKSEQFGIDSERGIFWIDFPHGNAYYKRDDNKPHICVDAWRLGNATADMIIQGNSATSQNGVAIQGTIPKWICYTGDIISAYNNEGFAYDDNYAGRGRGIVIRIPDKHYIEHASWVFLSSPNLYPHNVREGVNINGVTGTMRDYGAGRTVFNGATFDGVLASGVANKGFIWNNDAYDYYVYDEFGYGGIGDGGMKMMINTHLIAYKGRRIGCVLAHSINLTPFRQIVISYRFDGTLQNRPFLQLNAILSRASVRNTKQVNATVYDELSEVKNSYVDVAIQNSGQLVLDVSNINEFCFLALGVYPVVHTSTTIAYGTLYITKIDFLN